MEIVAWLDQLKWLIGAVVAPVAGWLGLTWSRRSAAKRRQEVRINFLRGLPPQAKAVLVDFHLQGTHTQLGNPSEPIILLMAKKGILEVGPGGGTYDAVNSYLSIRPDFWEVMDDWTANDLVAQELIIDILQEAAYEREGREAREQ